MPRHASATKLPRPIEWVCVAAGIALVLRYRWILDDAFVYFRYADNLLFLGRGLVYNAGEYVEGFSSPLWMMLMVALRAARPDWWTLTAALSVISFVVFALLLVRLNRTLAPEGAVANVPLAYLAFCYGASCYFTSGLETPLVQIAAVAFALFVMNPASPVLQTAVGAMPLLRPELTLLLPVALLWARRRTLRMPWPLIGASVLLGGAWLAFRVWYYADFFPNTFYLKNDVSVRQGLVYVHQTLRTYHFYAMLAAFGAGAVWLGRKRRDGFDPKWTERAILCGVALAIVAYVVKIGGDFRHYRMLAFPFVLLVCSWGGLVEEWIARKGGPRSGWMAALAGIVAAAVAFSGVPPQLERHPVTLREGHHLAEDIGDAAWDRHHPALAFSPRNVRTDRSVLAAYRESPGPGHRGTITTSMCVDGYIAFQYRIVNSLGLTDAFLARTNARADWAGHKYSLHERAEDLVELHQRSPIHRDAFRPLVEEGRAPDWIRDNLASVEIVARKVYNRGDWRENLALAFTFPPRIEVPDLGVEGRKRMPKD